MALFLDTETTGLPDTHNLRWGEYPYYKKLDKYPYIILVGESNSVLQDKMIRGLLPLLLQSIGIIVVLQIVLYLIYHRSKSSG